MIKQGLVSLFLLFGFAFAACSSSSSSTTQLRSTSPASKGTSDATDACLQRAKTQLEMNECAASQLRVAVARLDAIRTQIQKTLPVSRRPDFDTVNDSWRTYRDQHCEIANYKSEGGSSHSLQVTLCRARLTQQRSTTLEASFENSRL